MPEEYKVNTKAPKDLRGAEKELAELTEELERNKAIIAPSAGRRPSLSKMMAQTLTHPTIKKQIQLIEARMTLLGKYISEQRRQLSDSRDQEIARLQREIELAFEREFNSETDLLTINARVTSLKQCKENIEKLKRLYEELYKGNASKLKEKIEQCDNDMVTIQRRIDAYNDQTVRMLFSLGKEIATATDIAGKYQPPTPTLSTNQVEPVINCAQELYKLSSHLRIKNGVIENIPKLTLAFISAVETNDSKLLLEIIPGIQEQLGAILKVLDLIGSNLGKSRAEALNKIPSDMLENPETKIQALYIASEIVIPYSKDQGQLKLIVKFIKEFNSNLDVKFKAVKNDLATRPPEPNKPERRNSRRKSGPW